MKKLLLTLAMGLLAWSASAQNWTVGGRIGSGFQAVGQYVFSNDNYVEARFGAYWANAGGTVTADFSVLFAIWIGRRRQVVGSSMPVQVSMWAAKGITLM